MNINETVTDLDYIEYEVKKISNEHGISFDDLMDEFTNMLLTTVLDSKSVLEEMRRNVDKNRLKTV